MNAFHRVVSPLAVALVLSLTGFAEAGVNAFWKELGGSASGNGLSQLPSGNTSASPSVAVGADGRPVVTYVESAAGAGLAPGAVDLLSAADFAVLAGSTVTNAGTAGTVVTGDIGLSPGSAVTGFPPGSVVGTIHVNDPAAVQAKLDLTTAYNDAAGRTAPAPVTIAGNIGGMTLAPGLYKSTSTLEITSGDLTLDGGGNANAVWIFQIASTLTTGPGRQVILSGGAQASNIFWQVGTSATIGTTSAFKGTILADQSITLNTGATLDGRALARIAAVSLDGTVVTKPGAGSGGAGAAGGGIVVQRWTGSAWQTLSGPSGIGQGVAPQIKISSNGTLYVAWLQDEGAGGVQVHLLRRTTSSSVWEQLGGSNSPGGLTALANGSSVGAFSLIAGSDGNPVVAFDAEAQTGIFPLDDGVAQGVSQVYVRRYNGSNAWPYVGSDPSTGGGASNAISLNVTGGYALHFAANPALAVQGDGTLVVAFQYGTFYDGTPAAGFIAGNTEIFATQFSSNTSTWTALGPAVPTADGTTAQGGVGGVSNNGAVSGAPALAIRGITPTTNEIWVAWLEGDNVFARRYDALSQTWVELAGSGSGTGISDPAFINGDPAVTVDTGNDPVVVWSGQSPGVPRQVFVKQAESGFFTEMGQDSADLAGISDAALNAFTPMIAAPPSGTAGPAVVWLDQKAANNQVFLRQFATATAFTLNVILAGATNGSSVTSTPIGIACPSDPDGCTAIFPSGQVVSLVPDAGPNQKFTGWSGSCSGAGACNVTMNANRTVTATFVAGFALSVSKLGTGAAFATITGTGINCGTDCSEDYLPGTVVTLSRTLPTGTLFDGWGGDCAFRGTNTTCALTMSANRNASATFTQRKQLLTVLPGLAPGFATSSPAGIDCGNFVPHTDCTELYDYGTTVALTPFEGPGGKFDGWIGCSRLNGSICLVDMTANKTVTEKFVNARTLSLDASGNGAGKITANTAPPLVCTNSVTGCAVSQLVPINQSVTLTPAPATGSNFQWVGGVCTGSGPCKTVMSTNQSATGLFSLNHQRLDVTQRLTGTVVSTGLTPDVVDCGTLTSDCSTVQDFGAPVHLQATADAGFVFINWTGTSPCSTGAQATNASCSFQIKGNVTATPNYRAGTSVTLTKSGSGQGTVAATGTLSPSTVSCGPTCTTTSFKAFDGLPVTLKATPNAGSRFVNFTGDCLSNSPQCTFIPGGANDSVNAQFVLEQFNLKVSNIQDGNVVSTTPAGIITCGFGGNNCTEELDFNLQVILVATPNADAIFVKWTGTVCNGSTNASCAFKVPSGQVTVTPNYRARTVINVNKTGTGAGLVTSAPAGINCGTDCTEPIFDNVAVKLTAAPSPGSSFAGFSGGCVSSALTCTFVPAGASQNVSAQFVLQQFNLSVTSVASGNVTSTTPPGAINCGATGSDCAETLNFSTPVTLVAAPNSGVAFVKWTGDAVCSGKTNATCAFTMPNRNVPVTPVYRVQTIVNVIKTGNGAGVVTSAPAGINCGTDCSQTFFDSTPVTLTATPSTGSDFGGFSGSCTSNTSTCTFTPSGNSQNISAAFTLESRTVNVTVNGDGVVMSGPVGCDAATDPCAFTGPFGSSVVFTSTPGAGNKVLTQTGCTSTTTGTNASTCTVLLNQTSGNKSVVVTFSFLMSVTKSGDGTGTVTSTPAGINCGTDCSQQYTPGTSVTLNRTAAAGSSVGNWGGDCAFRGFNASCTLAMTQNQVVDAGFSLPLPLSVTKLGSGNGSVTSSPAGITCGADCSQSYAFGTSVTLTATAASGSIFGGFGVGNCDSQPTNVSCRVSMTSNRTVTALFNVPASGPSLGSAAPFAGLGGTAGMTNQGLNTVINGNIGTTGASTLITGFHEAVSGDVYTETPLNIGVVNGLIFTDAPAPGSAGKAATAQAALNDATTAFNALSPALMPGGIDLGNGELGGRTLAPGVYQSAPGTYAITLVDLVLDGQGDANAVWVFQMASTLTVGNATSARSVILINGAQAKNVFWQVGSAATINAAGGGTMVGTIIASSGAAFSTAGNDLPAQVVTLNGRALGLNASVTLVNTVINVPAP